jgi:hypothetical protein
MKRNTLMAAASIIAATLLVVAATTHAFAQGAIPNQRTFLTFSGTMQMPGVMLPAGTYVLRIADPEDPSVMQVLDQREHHVLGSWFVISTRDRTPQEVSQAKGKPQVIFHETPEGMPPAVRIFYHPGYFAGEEFLYPMEQARILAEATHHQVLATSATPGKGGRPSVVAVAPESTEAANNAAAAPPAGIDQNTEQNSSQAVKEEPQPAATTGTEPAEPQAVGTTGREQAPSPNSAAQPTTPAELPRTASPLPLVGLIGLSALIGAIGFRLARASAV